MPGRIEGASVKPRKSPRQSRSLVTVELILEAAARILEDRGMGGYTTNAVAERAGVSIGSLYQYFPGKDALTASLLVRESRVLIAAVIDAAGDADAVAALTQMIRAAVAHQMERPVLARLLDMEERRLPVDALVQGVTETLVSAIRTALCRLPESSPPLSPDVAAPDILAIVKGVVDAAGERGETASRHLEERVTRAVFGYLGLSEPVRRTEPRGPLGGGPPSPGRKPKP